MKLRIFSVAGEALNFGARRMETIMRVAWLPVTLLLIAQMTLLFGYLSVASGRFISFSDVRSFAQLKGYFWRALNAGVENQPIAMLAMSAGFILVALILYSSFMAPLIRYAGLGVRPSPGIVRLPFGADQIRFILSGIFSFLIIVVLFFAPMATATFFVVKYINEAMSRTMASFPNPESLHTIELVTARDALAANGGAWFYDIGVPLVAAAPFVLIAWIGLIRHFHPKNRAPNPKSGAGAPNLLARAIFSLIGLAAVVGLIFLGLATMREADLGIEGYGLLAMTSIFIFIIYYVNIRLAPYPGVAVCRKSMGPGNLFALSRGWNVVRLFVTFTLVSVFLTVTDLFINQTALGWIGQTMNALFQATAVSTKLLNSGEQAGWVLPFFLTIWSLVKILINIFWMFFSAGVAAGLLGRLYRESEKSEAAPAARVGDRAVWRTDITPGENRELMGDL